MKNKYFTIGFLLFWFGFLIAAAYTCIRDKNYGMLLYTLPFGLAGITIAKKRLSNKKSKKNSSLRLPTGIIISIALVLITIALGILLLVQGIATSDMGMIFAGGFFAFGAFTFVLGALTLKGCFDKCKVDVLGLYAGVFFVVIGAGIIAMISKQAFGFWIVIPILMIVSGVFQILKCLKTK